MATVSLWISVCIYVQFSKGKVVWHQCARSHDIHSLLFQRGRLFDD